MRSITAGLTALLILLLGGCALPSAPSTPSRPALPDGAFVDELAAPRAGYARLFLIRPARGFAADVWPEVHINAAAAVGLRNGRYSFLYLSPGSYQIDARKGQWYSPRWRARTELFAEPGQTYYLLFVQTASRDGWRWQRVDRARAAGALRDLRYIEADADTF